MAALRKQNALAMAAWLNMRDAYYANEEVTELRAQLAAAMRGNLPKELADAATALDAKLATFGGAARGGGRGGGGGGGGRGGGGNAPGGVSPFNALNATFNTVLAPLSQDGIDMPPSKAQIDTWEAGCRAYTATVNAWKAMLDESFFAFNSQLTKSNLPPLKVPATVSAPASCTFAGSK
jgi:hypothetical protein